MRRAAGAEEAPARAQDQGAALAQGPGTITRAACRFSEVARAVAALPPESVRITKALLERPHAAALEERMAEELRIFFERLGSLEAKAKLGAFFQRKKG